MTSGFKKKSPIQLQILERSYAEEKYPNQQKMAKCAESIGLTYNQVKTWFKERRRKEKREIEGAKNQSNCSISTLTSTKVNSNQSRKTSLSLVQKKRRFVQMQVLFPKDYVLRRVFRKDGPPLGMEFDSPSQRSVDHKKDIQKLRACTESQTAVKKRKILEAPIERFNNTTNLPKKHGMGKGLMTIWHVTNSQNGEFPCELRALLGRNASFNSSTKSTSTVASSQKSCTETKNKKFVPKQIVARKKKTEKKKPPNKKKAPSKRAIVLKSHSPTECELSANGPESSEGQDGQSTLVDDEELELRELQSGPNPLRCSAHLFSSGRHGCALCKDLLARFPPQNVKMKQPFSARPWDSSPELVKKLFKVLRFLYTSSTRVDVHPFTIDEFAQSFHDKDSMLLGKVHMALLKLLLSDAEKGKIDNFVPFSSKDSRFLSFLNFFREQELDVSFLMRSLNPLTWIEILRQVLVAAGFGSKNSLLRRGSFSKEKDQMVKYGLRPQTLKGELFTVLSKIGSCGLKVSELANSPQIIELDLPNSIQETEQLIHLTLLSDITLFEKIAPNAYRLRVDPRIKGTNPNSDSEDSGSVEDEESRDIRSTGSSSSDESDCSEEISSSRKDERIAKYREIDESYSGEAWVLGLMEGEYSDLRVDEKLDGLIALVDLIGGASSCLRIEEPRAITATAPTLHRFHASGGKIKKSTYPVASNCDKVQSSPSNTIQAPLAGTTSSEASFKMQTVHLGSDRRYNNYWLFLGLCARDDPGHRMVFFESSDDGHWEVIDTAEDLLELLSVLDTRGTRESSLFASLNRRQSYLCQSMEAHHNKSKGDNVTQTSSSNSVISSGDGSSPISDIDNNNSSCNNATIPVGPTGALVIESGRTGEEKRQKWERIQEFDKWVWDSFYLNLSAVRFSKRLLADTWARCQGCHDLYWREEKHCRICHSTFELDFEQEERYAMHLITCKNIEGICEPPSHRVHASQLQALKAAIHAIEAAMPDMSLVSSWMKSAHKLWVNRLQRTSSLPELLQVLVDFVGAINEDWLYECAKADGSVSVVDDVTVSFQTMPQTSSALALWVFRLDSLISSHLEKPSSKRPVACVSSSRRKQLT